MVENKELIIKTSADIDDVLSTLKSGFDQEKTSPVAFIIKFDENITVDDLKICLSKLWEFETISLHSVDILIKNLSYEHRKEALRLALKTPTIINNVFLTNVFCLIKQSNTFNEAYFNNEQVFVNDEVELLDILDDLEVEISEVTKTLAEYYISMLKTCHLVDAVENNPNTVRIESLYEYLFTSVDVVILARILSSVKDPTIWETKKIVYNSLGYLGAIAEKFVFTNSILNVFSAPIFEFIPYVE